jgi:transcription elongation factor GreA
MTTLEKEIERIRYELSVTIPEELQEATFSGDVLESSEYSEILSRQYFLNARLIQLNKRLHAETTRNSELISYTHVGVGSLVELLCKRTHVKRQIKLISCEVSDEETSYEEVTVNSPIGKALYNKSINDEINVYTPSGIQQYQIVSLTTIHNLKS